MNSEKETEILRLAISEAWPPGSIARALDVHSSVVDRVVRQAFQAPALPPERPKITDAYVQLVQETLAKYPRICASRLFQMAVARGYPGRSQGHFRRLVRGLRPRPAPEAFLRLATLPGEEAQIDWAEFGRVTIGRAERKLVAFIMTLPHSRAVFVRFFLSLKTCCFLEGIARAFEFFDGVPRRILHDNLKSGVIARDGTLVQFNEELLALCRHYHTEARATGVRRPTDKGSVERSVRYVRDNFFAGREWTTLSDLNNAAHAWCSGPALSRAWRRGDDGIVGDALARERNALLPLPPRSFVSSERVSVKVGRSPYVRFDGNDYSVPPVYARSTLTVSASQDTVSCMVGAAVVSEHPRSFSKHETFTKPEHVEDVLVRKKRARSSAGLARLQAAVPAAESFLGELAGRGENLGGAVASLLRCLERHGVERLRTAMDEVVAAGSFRLVSVHHVLNRIENEHRWATPVAVPLSLPVGVANMSVVPHDLSAYDAILNEENAHES